MKEIVKSEQKTPVAVNQSSPVSMFQMAMSQGADLNQLEKMMDMQERWEANEAKKAYVQAMAKFKTNPPEIFKDKRVNFKTQKGTTSYSHAGLGNVTRKINASLGDCGLSASWDNTQSKEGVTVTCTITHKLGHSEKTSLTSPPDSSGTKNQIQAMGSTISYLQRYTLLSLTGLATQDTDDDGQASKVLLLNEKQISSVVDMMVESGVDQADYLKYLGVSGVNEIDSKNFNRIIKELEGLKK